MDLLAFIAAIVEALAWPSLLVVLLIVLKDEVKALVPGLQKLRYREFELEFREQLEEAEDQLGGLDSASTLAPPAGGSVAEEDEVAEAPIESAPADYTLLSSGEVIDRLAPISPRAAVAEAWLQVEHLLRQVADQSGLDAEQSAYRLAEALASRGLLSKGTASSVEKLRTLRNEVVHRPNVEISPQSAIEYAGVARRVKRELAPLAAGGS